MHDPIRVLVVDDSIVMRHFITQTLAATDDIQVVGTAGDGEDAVEQARRLRPDVITLDVLMPRLSGLEALALIMQDRPTAVVMFSSTTSEGSEATVRALELGAVDFVAKPPPGTGFADRSRIADDLVRKIRRAALAQPRALNPGQGVDRTTGPKREPGGLADLAVVIGCSTGGPQALTRLIPELPADLPAAVIVVQHMPPGFTRTLAERLDSLSAMVVREAADGDLLRAGQVLVAPGGRHTLVDGDRRVRLGDGPNRHGVRPSVDVTLESAAVVYGPCLLAMVLTGMGLDGAEGAVLVKQHGGTVVAEHASTCVVYGMPRAVTERGISDYVTPLHQCSEVIGQWIRAQTLPRRTMATSS